MEERFEDALTFGGKTRGKRQEAEFRLESVGYRKKGNSQNIKMNPQMTWGQADAWAEARPSPASSKPAPSLRLPIYVLI